jgi:hypothetical protein
LPSANAEDKSCAASLLGLKTLPLPPLLALLAGGGNTEAATCEAYGFSVDKDKCTHSAADGGGNQCGKTTICCVVWTPTQITPGADGRCLPKRP